MELLYQEWLRTRPWDIILAIVVITAAAGVPTAVAIGTWIQKMRADAGRRLPWLRSRPRPSDETAAGDKTPRS
ncbi:MAG TPA: hypothetical protein VIE40_07970 [Dehalococcoidia bacterium]|jgi:hypothetical protein